MSTAYRMIMEKYKECMEEELQVNTKWGAWLGQGQPGRNSISSRPITMHDKVRNKYITKNGRAAGFFPVTANMLKASDNVGVRMVTNLMNTVVKAGTVPENWLQNVTAYVRRERWLMYSSEHVVFKL